MTERSRLRTKLSAGFNWAADNQPAYATALSLILIVVSPVVSFGVGHATGKWVPTLIGTQAVVAALLWGIPFLQKRKAERAEVDARVQARATLSDVLDPLMEEMATLAMAAPALRAKQQARIQTLVLTAASNLIGPDRSRASFFRYSRAIGRNPDKTPRTIHLLQHDQSLGRGQAARAMFQSGTPGGDAAIKMVREGGASFVPDVSTDPPPGWDASKRGKYKTYISVAVRAKTRPLGMLTLDSKNPGDLSEDDLDLLRVFAWILAASLAIDARMGDSQPAAAATTARSPLARRSPTLGDG